MKIKFLASTATAIFVGVVGLLIVTTGSAAAAADTCTWTGGGSDQFFGTAANWSGCDTTIPEAGDSLVFPFQDVTAVDNLHLGYASITLTGGSGTPVNIALSGNGGGTVKDDGPVTVGDNVNLTMSTPLEGSYVNISQTGSANFAGGIVATGLSSPQFEVVGKNCPVTPGPSDVGTIGGKFGVASNLSAGTVGSTTNFDMRFRCTQIDNFAPSNAHHARLLVNNSVFKANQFTNFGTTSVPTIFTSSQLKIPEINQDFGAAEDFSFNGNLYGSTTASARADANLATILIPGNKRTITTGEVTLLSDITVASTGGGAIEFAGAMVGDHSIIGADGISTFTFIFMNATSNQTTMPNGRYGALIDDPVLAFDGNFPLVSHIIQANQVGSVNGTRANIGVYGTLKGSGTAGVITVYSGGHVAPGNSPGCLNVGNTTYNSGSFYDVEIAGKTACSEYDQLKVTGNIDLGGATLTTTLLNSYRPSMGDVYTIVDASGTLTGTFNGLAEGATVTVDGVNFTISYANNKVTLTVAGGTNLSSAPSNAVTAPDTGFGLVAAHPFVTLLISTASAGALFLLARRMQLVPSAK